MKCPVCGSIIREDKDVPGCSRCRERSQGHAGIKVEYKDFKLSELLEIRPGPLKEPPARPNLEKGQRKSSPGQRLDSSGEVTRTSPPHGIQGPGKSYARHPAGDRRDERTWPRRHRVLLIALTLLAGTGFLFLLLRFLGVWDL